MTNKYELEVTEVSFDETGKATNSGWVKCYLTNPETGEFTKADMEYVMEGFSLPSGAYLDAPVFDEIPQDKALVRVVIDTDSKHSEWALIDDFRGRTVYNKTTKEEFEVKEIGSLSNEFTLKKPKSVFDIFDEEVGDWVEDTQAKLESQIDLLERKKQALISEVERLILPLDKAEKLGIITEDEADRLEIYETYLVALSRVIIDGSITDENILFPIKPF